MKGTRRRTPWIAAAAVLACPAAFGGPPGVSPPPGLVQTGLPTEAEARAMIETFRESGPAKPYYLEFTLRQLPRRGEEIDFRGRLWSERGEDGTVMRIEVNPGSASEMRFLATRGAHATVWRFDPKAPSSGPKKADFFEPLVPGTEITPFELLMPYLYWPDERLVGVFRIRGRPADLFLFPAPNGLKSAGAPLKGVQSYLDTEYHAPVETDLIAADGRPLKTLSLVDLDKVEGQWIPKDIDIRNDDSRDKTRFSITAAALGLDLLPALFDPSNLAVPVEPPAAGQIVRLTGG